MLTKPELEALSLVTLAEQLALVRETRTGMGWETDNAVMKARLERRIVEIVCGDTSVEDESQVQVEHTIEIDVHGMTIEAHSVSIRPGGIWIASDAALKDGSPAIAKIRTENNYPLKVKCVIRNRETGKQGFSLDFAERAEAEQRRVERLVLGLLKNQES